jgi:hypothetical protein
MHCPQGAAEAGTWRSSAYKLGTGNRHVVNQQPTGEAARRQTPDARRQQPARAYVAPRYYFRHLQPPLAHALTPTHPQYTHTLNACNCYNIWLATTLHLMHSSHRHHHHHHHHHRHPSSIIVALVAIDLHVVFPILFLFLLAFSSSPIFCPLAPSLLPLLDITSALVTKTTYPASSKIVPRPSRPWIPAYPCSN